MARAQLGQQQAALRDPSPTFPFLKGQFNKTNYQISYFSMTMEPSVAAEVFHLTSELPKPQEPWKIEELYQRDIDWKRVEDQLIPYLRDADKATFLGALTIAILPYKNDPNDSKILESCSQWDQWTPPQFDDGEGQVNFPKQLEVGPMSFGWHSEWEDLRDTNAQEGWIKWEKNQVMAVAIDGQHRLAAYKLMSEDPTDRVILNQHRIPVNLLVFEEDLGFKVPTDGRKGMAVLRDLFIDLNKHAEQVSKTREYLLDDLSPQARCVRELIAKQQSDKADSLASESPTIPLSLVDWHGDSNKFDSGPYTTTVVLNHWLVCEILKSKGLKDYTNHKQVGNEIDNFEKILDIDLSTAKGALAEVENDDRIFTYQRADLDLIGGGFSKNWVPLVCAIIREFTPYKDLTILRRADDSLKANFQEWYFLKERKGLQAEKELQSFTRKEFDSRQITSDDFEEMLTNIEEHKKDQDIQLAFKVVFQKAIFKAWLEFMKFHVVDLQQIEDIDGEITNLDDDEENVVNETPTPATLTRFEHQTLLTDQFIAALNRLVAEWPTFLNQGTVMPANQVECMESRFWVGSLLRAEDDKVEHGTQAVNRTTQLLFTLIAMVIYDQKNDPQPGSSFEDFWTKVWFDENPNNYIKKIRKQVEWMISEGKEGGGQAVRILRAGDNDYDEDDCLLEVSERLKFVWTKLGL